MSPGTTLLGMPTLPRRRSADTTGAVRPRPGWQVP